MDQQCGMSEIFGNLKKSSEIAKSSGSSDWESPRSRISPIMKRQIHPRSGSHQLESRCGLLLEMEITPNAESTKANDAKYTIIS
jgi:hypothetical protein